MMQEGKKRGKEKKRGHCDREQSDGEMKRNNTGSSTEEPSDLEEGGLDLNKIFRPISSYMQDREEMLEQCFHVLGEKKLLKMLPDQLKDSSFSEIKKLCWDQLQQLSDVHLLEILEGKELSAAAEEKNFADSQQDSNVDSTSSLREDPETEEKQGAGSGEDSDVLSINAEIDDSDIEGHKVVKAEESARDEALAPSAEPKVELQQDIDRSVSEILAPMSGSEPEDLREASPEKPLVEERAPASAVKQPSTQQLELLELEMRARAIKALMKASETHKHTHS
ncbi:caspase activity and apoptosis inhibitor 1-like [Carassius carassius]|uniref:caspase activity and apoptosis inhibitor 1-like n=1 Tax=Carassius carassius TaxID=217509 RepID=UPI0028691A04|nr:caspase activity and apoptosis inhibitor 1-like [Carassius carassius]XP_059375224.1 caspase activity and apoptosis inhibitor 1-like [Carassius carassius]